jgi:uncharacterized phosphosugar-binding protein
VADNAGQQPITPAPDGRVSGMRRYLEEIVTLEERVVTSQAEVLDRVAVQMVETLKDDRRIFVFGTGHSHLIAEEAFYRAGGLAAAVPIFAPPLMLHEGAAFSSLLERQEGLAEPLLAPYQPQPGEMLFVFSNSGVNQLPVEMALAARARGLFVVGVSAHAYAHVAPLSELGRRLDEVVDAAIDNGGVPGDALVPVGPSGWRVGPASTITAALIWNGLVTEAVARLQADGMEAPVFASLNMNGAAAHNEALLEKWRGLNPHL